MIARHILLAALLALPLGAAAQATPAANFTDMWWNPNESGWGISFTQHVATNQVYAVMYTYDPRDADVSTADSADYRPLWIVMSGGNWVTPTQVTGNVFVTNGTPFFQSGSNTTVNAVGTFTFNFTDFSNATFTYNLAPQGNLSPSDPAFGLPAFNGVKSITRQSF
jgi:hypothetical protein